MSLIYHSQNPALAEVFAAGIAALEQKLGDKYYEYANALSPQDVRDRMEAIMTITQPLRYSRVAQVNYAQGKRDSVRTVLRARGVSLTDAQSAQIDACNDVDTLTSWLEAASTARSASDIFG